jgi:putative ABC transport system ATP-binding protein
MMIAALMRPDSGAVLVDGREVSQLSYDDGARYRLHELGYVDQSLELLPGARVIENASIKLWLTDIRNAERRVRPLLDRLGLGERLHHRPDQLSMGERQRVMIARALSTDPKLVLADEPTGSLDTRRGREVLELLSEICRERGAAALLVTHDPQAAAFADRVHALRDGQLVDYEPDHLFALPEPVGVAGAGDGVSGQGGGGPG